jgi:hypothetical protein
MFDMPTEGGGLPMLHILNYLNTYNNTYAIPTSRHRHVLRVHDLHWLNDAMWAKYS